MDDVLPVEAELILNIRSDRLNFRGKFLIIGNDPLGFALANRAGQLPSGR